jgi:protein-S-isoprenylcysteine O-methyltransferase Ste14
MVALSRWRIEIGFLFGILVLLTAEPTRRAVVAGLPFMVVGIALRGWARGHLTRRGRLTQTGPYALVRHPLYVGSFLLGLGFAIMASVALVPLGFVIVFAVMYVPKALREEAFLRERYGDEYDAYAQRVGRFVPKLRRASREEWNTEWFSWERVFGHREHLTWLGTAAALVLVWAAAVGWLHRVGMYAQDHVPWLSDLARMR